MTLSPKISVIILNYNGARFIQHCLNTVFACTYPNFEVIVADNCSTDGSFELIETHFYNEQRLKCVRFTRNWGFACGNNRIAEIALGRYLMLLNMDTEVDENYLDQIVNIFESDDHVGIVQSRIKQMQAPSIIQSAGYYLDWLGLIHIRGEGEEDKGQYSLVDEIFGATGAAFAVRAELFKEIGGFDNDYFCYFEETDLCWRTWLMGYSVVFAPLSIVYHYGGGGSDQTNNNKHKNQYLFVRNRIATFVKVLELPILFWFLPLHIVALGVYGVMLLIQFRDSHFLTCLLQGILWNARHLGKTLSKRKTLQNSKLISNWLLMKKGIIQTPTIALLSHKREIEISNLNR